MTRILFRELCTCDKLVNRSYGSENNEPQIKKLNIFSQHSEVCILTFVVSIVHQVQDNDIEGEACWTNYVNSSKNLCALTSASSSMLIAFMVGV